SNGSNGTGTSDLGAEPGDQRVTEPWVASVARPGNLSVGPDQHSGRSGDIAQYRPLPRPGIVGVDEPDTICPPSGVEATGLIEIEHDRSSLMQQGEHPQWAVGGDQVQIGHAAPEQRVSLAEVVVDVETRHHPGEPLPGLLHAEELRDALAQGLDPVV